MSEEINKMFHRIELDKANDSCGFEFADGFSCTFDNIATCYDDRLKLYELVKQLQQENQRLKDELEASKQYEDYYKGLCDKALKTGGKYISVIKEIREYINNYDVFKEFSFPLMKRDEENQVKSSIDYEFQTSIKKSLLQILDKVKK